LPRLDFLKKSSHAPWLAREVLDWQSRELLYQYVSGKLIRQGIAPPKPKGVGQIPLLQKILWEETSVLREIISVGLPMVVCLGLGFFIWKGISVSEYFETRRGKTLFKIYLLFIAAYVVWVGHLFLHLPSVIQPEEVEIFLLLIIGISLILFSNWARDFIERKKVLSDPMLRECPKCNEIIPKLDLVCPFCNENIE